MAERLSSPPPLPGLGTSKISLPSRSIQAELHNQKKKKFAFFLLQNGAELLDDAVDNLLLSKTVTSI